MAREYARNPLWIWDDPAYTELTPAAQHLDYVLRHGPGVSYCGRVDWRPARLLPRARGWTLATVEAAAAEYAAAGFGLFDAETEEALLCKHIRWDELLRNPKMAVALVHAYHAVASRKLRAAVLAEIELLHREFPEFSSWTHPMSAAKLAQLLPVPVSITDGMTDRIGDPDRFVSPDTRHPIPGTARRGFDAHRAHAISRCDLCDEHGYQGTRVCDHDAGTAERARRGIAAVRAAMVRRPGATGPESRTEEHLHV